MTSTADQRTARRTPLTRARVLGEALALADASGLDAVTMRRLAERLGVEPMSLYHHVPNKDALLDGLIALVFDEVDAETGGHEVPDVDPDWKASLRTRILAARRVMLRHPWAPGLMQSRVFPGAAMAGHADAVVGTLRSGGFSYDLIHHAMHALGSRMFGFSQELVTDDGDAEEAAAMAARTPHLVAMLAEVAHDDPDSTIGWCDDATEFGFALDLLLDGLESLSRREG
ncbi:TetR/AcrR family transcriptional regulator [Agromyces sp. SYSU T00194]|uniref:TetR/AcrR family transcriptional regulator n=1 Tax=Agromyces chitinivorans TaxID=3158560 RepID=UPI0033930B98